MLATSSRARSSTGCAALARPGRSTKGPPRWNVPTCVIAPAPGIPFATMSACTTATSCVPPADENVGGCVTARTVARANGTTKSDATTINLRMARLLGNLWAAEHRNADRAEGFAPARPNGKALKRLAGSASHRPHMPG
ncbi:MAG TPA: hypothetical protein VGJ39_06595 [Vicinamibacterales bacterium]